MIYESELYPDIGMEPTQAGSVSSGESEVPEPFFDDDGDQDDEAKLNWSAVLRLYGESVDNALPGNEIPESW